MTVTTPSENVARYFDALRRRRGENDDAPAGANPEMDALRDDFPDSPAPISESTTFGLIELLLKDQPRLDAYARSPEVQRELIPRLLLIGLCGYAIFAVVLCVVFGCGEVWPQLTPMAVWLEHPQTPLIRFATTANGGFWRCWVDGSALHLIAAFTFGLIGAIGVCLPSFYFYGLLAGVRTTMLQVTTSALNGLASGAIAVLGALPIYLAVMLGLIIFHAPAWAVADACFVGLALPFITGLYGTRALYIGFMGLTDTLPDDRRCRRTCFLRRLLFAWSVCYTAVTPVMIFALWESMSR